MLWWSVLKSIIIDVVKYFNIDRWGILIGYDEINFYILKKIIINVSWNILVSIVFLGYIYCFG